MPVTASMNFFDGSQKEMRQKRLGWLTELFPEPVGPITLQEFIKVVLNRSGWSLHDNDVALRQIFNFDLFSQKRLELVPGGLNWQETGTHGSGEWR